MMLSVVMLLIAAAPAYADQKSPISAEEVEAREQVSQARESFDALDYEEVLPIVERVLAMAGVSVLTRLDAYLLQGSSLAIVGNPIEAEKAFRFLLRAHPDYDMPPETSPKIIAVFRKVQVEEKAIREQVRALRRAALIRELEIKGSPPTEVTGGEPIEFAYNLRDRRGVVNTFQVHYRRASESDFSSLALRVSDAGQWVGLIPGEWSENETGFGFEYFLVTEDESKESLLTVGARDSPMSLAVLPGTVAQAAPIYERAWFWTVVAVGVGAVVGSSWYVYDAATELPESPLGQHEVR